MILKVKNKFRNMSMDKVLWWNCFQVLIIINFTLCQSKFNGTHHGLGSIGLPEKTTIKLLVEPDKITDSLLLNSELKNDYDGIERKNLMSLYELKKKNYLSLINDERTQILNQMQTISEIINSFTDKANTSETRVTRSVSPRPKCTISKEKLENLQKEIHIIIANSTEQNVTDIKCTLNFNSTDNCNNLLKAIQCGLDHVKNGFIEAMLNQGSGKDVTKWKNAFDELSKKFVKEKDDLMQSFSHEHQLELDKLHKQIQDLGKLLNNALDRLEKNTIELCVMEIVQGLITEAVDHFKELKSTPMYVIVKQAYNYNKHSNPEEIERVAYIAEFIERVPQKRYVEALNTFFKEMKAKNHMNSVRVLILYYSFVQFTMPDSELTSEFPKFVDPVLSTLTDVVTFNKKDTEFHKFLRFNSGKYFDYFSGYIINGALNLKSPDVSTRLKNILDCIKNFPYYHQAADGFAYVNDYLNAYSLQENQNILRLAYYVNYFKTKLLTTNNIIPNNSNLTQILIQTFENINNKLPKNVVNFIVHPNSCKIRNSIHQEHLYATEQFKVDSDRRNVFLWLFAPSGSMETEGQWKFETTNNCESFTIKNVRYNEYLYAADMLDNRGNPRRPVYTWQPQVAAFPEAEWEVIPRHGDYFTLRHVYRNEYLYADGASFIDDGKRRNVFTWKNGVPTGEMWSESLWQIYCYHL